MRLGPGGETGSLPQKSPTGPSTTDVVVCRPVGIIFGSMGAPSWSDARAICPRPLLVRQRWASLDGEWEFALDRQAAWREPAEVRWDGRIRVPFSPETALSGVAALGFFSACWYRLRAMPFITADELMRGHRLLLHFGAVDHHAEVWANARWCGEHEGGLHAVHLRRHPARRRRAAGDRGARARRPAGSRQAARQAGLAAGAALHLVSADHRHLADGVVGGRPAGAHPAGALDPQPRPVGDLRRDRARRGGSGRRARIAAPRPRRPDAGARQLRRAVARGESPHRLPRSGHRRLPQRAALEPALSDAAGGDRRAAGPRRAGARSGQQLHGAALDRRPGRPHLAQRPPLSGADGARSGLLAAIGDDRPRRGRPPPRRRAGQGHGLQRRAQAPEDRGPALSLLGRPPRPVGLGGDAQRLSVHHPVDRAAHAGMDGRPGARLQPPLHHGLGAVQRIVGRAESARQARPSATRCRGSIT